LHTETNETNLWFIFDFLFIGGRLMM
jgi:hypothetical protein